MQTPFRLGAKCDVVSLLDILVQDLECRNMAGSSLCPFFLVFAIWRSHKYMRCLCCHSTSFSSFKGNELSGPWMRFSNAWTAGEGFRFPESSLQVVEVVAAVSSLAVAGLTKSLDPSLAPLLGQFLMVLELCLAGGPPCNSFSQTFQ